MNWALLSLIYHLEHLQITFRIMRFSWFPWLPRIYTHNFKKFEEVSRFPLVFLKRQHIFVIYGPRFLSSRSYIIYERWLSGTTMGKTSLRHIANWFLRTRTGGLTSPLPINYQPNLSQLPLTLTTDGCRKDEDLVNVFLCLKKQQHDEGVTLSLNFPVWDK